jgi:hypothetical protein
LRVRAFLAVGFWPNLVGCFTPRVSREVLGGRHLTVPAKWLRLSTVVGFAVLLAACDAFTSKAVYSLYRSSVVGNVDRVHVASFDTSEGESYNRENCELAAKLFMAQPLIRTRFWCERGKANK